MGTTDQIRLLCVEVVVVVVDDVVVGGGLCVSNESSCVLVCNDLYMYQKNTKEMQFNNTLQCIVLININSIYYYQTREVNFVVFVVEGVEARRVQ